MSEEAGAANAVNSDGEEEFATGYQAPAKVSVDALATMDADDESLVRYKEALLGQALAGGVKTDDPRRVVVEKMAFVVAGREDVELDLTGDLATLKDQVITIKEGCEYKLRVSFRVQNEIVSGLRYFMTTHRKGVRVDKMQQMLGSYGPKVEAYEVFTPLDEAPKGALARGKYTAKSKFSDDDKTDHLSWEWCFKIEKDW